MKRKEAIPHEAIELLARIENEFRGVPRPRITKHVARGWDDEWILSDERAAELAGLDPEQNWEDVSDEDIERFNEYFSFSDAEGWRFYLPAFMTYYLKNYSNRHMNPVEFAYHHSRDRLSLLSEAQRKCVEDFVKISEAE